MEAIIASCWAISKRSTNTESKTDVSRDVNYRLYHAYHRIIGAQQVVWKEEKHRRYLLKVSNRMMQKPDFDTLR